MVLLEEGKDLISRRDYDQHSLAGNSADRKPGGAVYWRDVRREEAARKGSFKAESILNRAISRRENYSGGVDLCRERRLDVSEDNSPTWPNRPTKEQR